MSILNVEHLSHGFGAGKKKTWLTERTRHKGDREITIFLGVCILAAVVWRIVGCL